MESNKHKTAGQILESEFPSTLQFLEQTIKEGKTSEEINKMAEKCEAILKSLEKS